MRPRLRGGTRSHAEHLLPAVSRLLRPGLTALFHAGEALSGGRRARSLAALQACLEPLLPPPPSSSSAESADSKTGLEPGTDCLAPQKDPCPHSARSQVAAASSATLAHLAVPPFATHTPPAHPPETHNDGDGVCAKKGRECGNGAASLKKHAGFCQVAQILPVNKPHSQQSIQPTLVLSW